MPAPQYNPQGLSTVIYPGVVATWDTPTTTLDLPSFDGKMIHGRVFLPPGINPIAPGVTLPTIYAHSPYDEDAVLGTTPGLSVVSPLNQYMAYFLPRGYAFVVTNVRGTGDSQGYIQIGNEIDARDFSAMCSGIAAQPWSDGNIGAWGLSYLGGMIARGILTTPANLRCAWVADPFIDLYPVFFSDGVQNNLEAAATAVILLTMFGLAPARNPATVLATLSALPERAGFLTDTFVSIPPNPNGNRTAPWAARDARAMTINGVPKNAANVNIPILYSRGFQDFVLSGQHDLEWLAGLTSSPLVKSVLGQGFHAVPDSSNFGGNGTLDAMLIHLLHAFYDLYLKGLSTNYATMPPALIEDQFHHWRTAASADVPPTYTDYRLDGATLTPTALGRIDGLFNESQAGMWTSAPFQQDTLVSGHCTLDLWLSLTQNNAHLTARIDVLAPDGSTITFYGFGALQAQHWLSLATQTPFPINTKTLVQMSTTSNSFLVPKGGRIRLVLGGQDSHTELGGSDLGGAWAFLPIGNGFQGTAASDDAHPSVLHLPIVAAPAYAQLPTAYDGGGNPTAWTPVPP